MSLYNARHKTNVDEELVRKRLSQGMSVRLIAQRIGCSYDEVDKIAKKIGEDMANEKNETTKSTAAAAETHEQKIDKLISDLRICTVRYMKSGMQTHEVQDLRLKMGAIMDLLVSEIKKAL